MPHEATAQNILPSSTKISHDQVQVLLIEMRVGMTYVNSVPRLINPPMSAFTLLFVPLLKTLLQATC